MGNPIKALHNRLNGRDSAREQVRQFDPNHYVAIDTSVATDLLDRATRELDDTLFEASKFFPETALPSAPEERRAVLLEFIHIQMGERNNRLEQRPRSQHATHFTQGGTQNQVRPIGELQQAGMQAEAPEFKQHYFSEAQKLQDRYQQAKHLETQFQMDAEDAGKWLSKCQTLETQCLHHQFVLHQLNPVAALSDLQEKGADNLTGEELDTAAQLFKGLELHKITTPEQDLEAKQAKLEERIAKVMLRERDPESKEGEAPKYVDKEQLPPLKILGSGELTPHLNGLMAELDRERLQLRTALENLKAQPDNVKLNNELADQQKKFDNALINVRQALAKVDNNVLGAANLVHSNFSEVFNNLERLRSSVANPWVHSQVSNWWNLKKTPGSIGKDINSLELSQSNQLYTWEYQRDGTVTRVPHYHKDKDGNQVPTKVSVQALLAAAARVEADPELMKKYGPITTKITREGLGDKIGSAILGRFYSGSSNIEKVRVTCGSESQKQCFIQEIVLPMQQQLDRQHQAKVEGEEEGEAKHSAASATLKQSSESKPDHDEGAAPEDSSTSVTLEEPSSLRPGFTERGSFFQSQSDDAPKEEGPVADTLGLN